MQVTGTEAEGDVELPAARRQAQVHHTQCLGAGPAGDAEVGGGGGGGGGGQRCGAVVGAGSQADGKPSVQVELRASKGRGRGQLGNSDSHALLTVIVMPS